MEHLDQCIIKEVNSNGEKKIEVMPLDKIDYFYVKLIDGKKRHYKFISSGKAEMEGFENELVGIPSSLKSQIKTYLSDL